MPIPGPRTQAGPVPGYDNPGLESPDRINMWKRPGSVSWPGRTPGTMVITLRGCILGAGQIRRLWRQAIGGDALAAPGYSWAANSPLYSGLPGVGITRALRYMTKSLYATAGNDNTRFAGIHTQVPQKAHHKMVTVNSGQKRGQPTVRNRVSSFGSRVPTLNQTIQAAENQQ